LPVLVEDEAVVIYFKDPSALRTPRPRTLSGRLRYAGPVRFGYSARRLVEESTSIRSTESRFDGGPTGPRVVFSATRDRGRRQLPNNHWRRADPERSGPGGAGLEYLGRGWNDPDT